MSCQALFFLLWQAAGQADLGCCLRDILEKCFCWQERNMKETLNQDTAHHESCQQLSRRGGMGPSVAAYEWLTDSHSF